MASPFLLDISRDMRLRGYSLQTEKTYLSIPAEFLGTNSLNSPIQLLEPHVFYALVVLRAALPGVQTVEVAKWRKGTFSIGSGLSDIVYVPFRLILKNEAVFLVETV